MATTPPPPPSDPGFVHYRTGDEVSITYGDRTVDGRVELASQNGRSIFLCFDALLGGHAGGMPAMWDDGVREFVSAHSAQTVKLARKTVAG